MGLEAFSGQMAKCPLDSTCSRLPARRLIVDYVNNPSSLSAILCRPSNRPSQWDERLFCRPATGAMRHHRQGESCSALIASALRRPVTRAAGRRARSSAFLRAGRANSRRVQDETPQTWTSAADAAHAMVRRASCWLVQADVVDKPWIPQGFPHQRPVDQRQRHTMHVDPAAQQRSSATRLSMFAAKRVNVIPMLCEGAM